MECLVSEGAMVGTSMVLELVGACLSVFGYGDGDGCAFVLSLFSCRDWYGVRISLHAWCCAFWGLGDGASRLAIMEEMADLKDWVGWTAGGGDRLNIIHSYALQLVYDTLVMSCDTLLYSIITVRDSVVASHTVR